MKDIIRLQGSNAKRSAPPRPLVLPTIVHARQASLPQSAVSQRQSTLLNAPCRQSTMPSLPHTGQQPSHALPSVPSRHHSLPAFKHGDGPHVHPMLKLNMPRPLATNASSSHSQSTSSHSHSALSPAKPQNQFVSFEPSVADHRGISKHLSMMPLSSSPREIQSAEGSSTTRLTGAKLTKPPPAHLM